MIRDALTGVRGRNFIGVGHGVRSADMH
jgi:hypothetical protein